MILKDTNLLKNKNITNVINNETVFNSKNEIVDGTNLTNNKEIIHRRKRKISKAGKIHAKCRIKEFLALCEFLAGERQEPLEKPTKSHMMLLADIRNNHNIRDSWQMVINDNFDIVAKASEFTEKKIINKWEDLQRSKIKFKKNTGSFNERLDNLINKKSNCSTDTTNIIALKKTDKEENAQKVINENTKEFTAYIEHLLDPSIVISKKKSNYYHGLISTINNSKNPHRSNYMTDTVNEHRNALKELHFTKHRKVPKNITWAKLSKIIENVLFNVKPEYRNDYYIKTIENSENYALMNNLDEKIAELDKDFNFISNGISKESIDYAKRDLALTNIIANKLKENEKDANAVNESIDDILKEDSYLKHTINDTLSLLLQLAKKSGATEITIKL